LPYYKPSLHLIRVRTQKTKIMKKLKFLFALNADAQGQTGTVTEGGLKTVGGNEPAKVIPAPTSKELVALQDEYKAKMALLRTLEGDEQESCMLETFALKGKIKAEIANIAKVEADNARALKLNERVQLATSLKDNAISWALLNNDKKSTEEDRARALDLLNASFDVVKTELVARYATSSPAKKDGTASPKGATGQRIQALHAANIAAGMTRSESSKAIVASGESRGTTDAQILVWEKENGLK
jgi:hypothetical protein